MFSLLRELLAGFTRSSSLRRAKAGDGRIELPPTVLETVVLPLN